MGTVRKSFLIAVNALALGSPLPAQPPDLEPALAAIRPQAIRAHMRFLADDLLEGRRTATRGYDLAAKYVAAQFEALGLEPGGPGGSYLQTVPLVEITTVDSECSVAFLHEGRKTPLRHGEEFLAGAGPGESTLTAPVVFAGYGVTAPELGYDDYAGIDVKGKIVALLAGAPSTFPPDQRAYYSDPSGKNREAIARGAAGILGVLPPEWDKVISWEDLTQLFKWPALGWAEENGLPHNVRSNVAPLSRKGAEALFVGSPHSLEEVFKNTETGRPLSFDMPIQASLHFVGRSRPLESSNVVAVLPGSDPKLKDEYVVLTAHLDHLGLSEPGAGDSTGDRIGDRIYNGAFDNASGVAILLEMANAFTRLPKPPRRSILFVAFTGEEEGLKGSDYFAHHPTLPIDRIVANVNLDMVLTLYPLRDVVAFGAEHSSLGPFVNEAARQLGIEVSPDPFPEQAMFIRSDHFPLVKKGVPAIFLTVGLKSSDPALDPAALLGKWMQETYHQPSDDIHQAIDFGALAQFTRLNLLISHLIAQSDKAPSWNPGDFFGEKFRRGKQ